jgi:signal transduction histidine kinase
MDTEAPIRCRQLGALTCAAVYVDRDGTILDGNEAFEHLWNQCVTAGRPAHGRTLLAVFAEDEHEMVRHVLDTFDVSMPPLAPALHLAASHVQAAVEFVPIRRKSYPGSLWLVTLRTDQRSPDLSDNEVSRAALTAGIVHDLRTPMQSVLGWASVLRRTREPERIECALTVIERNVKVQMELIEDLLEVLHSSSSRPRLRRQRVDLAKLVKAELRAVEPVAEESQIGVSLTIDSPFVDVEGNETHLRRVVANLVGNALKFTPRGGSIHCRVWRSAAWAGILVRDSGRGIDPAFVPRVFDAFSQESADHGWGLGLNVVRHLVKLHGGTITAASLGHGHGATFSVLLPAMTAGEVPLPYPAV